MIADIVDGDKNVQGLDNALKFFCGDKVLCIKGEADYEEAVKLTTKGFKRVYTMDGTSLTNGMFEGGHQTNIFNKTFGKGRIRKTLSQKENELKKLSSSILELSNAQIQLENSITQLRKDMIITETEVKTLEQKLISSNSLQEEQIKTIRALKSEKEKIDEELEKDNKERKETHNKVKNLNKKLSENEAEFYQEF